MHPDDLQKIKDLESTYEVLMRKYVGLLDEHEKLARKQATIEEKLCHSKTGLLPLWEKIDGLARRVEEVSRGEVKVDPERGE